MKDKNSIIEHLELQVHPFDESPFSNNPIVEDFTIYAFYQGEKVGYVMCYHESGRLYAFEVDVNEDYRRLGIATKMYDYAQMIAERTIFPHHENPHNQDSDEVSEDALLFWGARKK